MEERRSPHRVTQRLLDPEPGEDPGSTSLDEGSVGDPGPPTNVPPPIVYPRGASDVELRKRQRAWFRERSRYERNLRPRTASDE